MEYQRTDEEFKLILSRYKEIQRKLRPRATKEQKMEVRKAFTLAFNAHKDMRRRSGEPYILFFGGPRTQFSLYLFISR